MITFYSVFFVLVAVAMLIYAVAYMRFREGFEERVRGVLKVASVVYCVLVICSILLPDAFLLSYDADELTSRTQGEIGFAVLRWLASLGFAVIPLAVFFESRKMRSIALCFCLPVSIVSVVCAPTYLEYYTSELGRGLRSVSVISDEFKEILIDPDLRGGILALQLSLEIVIVVLLSLSARYDPRPRTRGELPATLGILCLCLLSCVPIYVPQHLFGYTDVIFESGSLPHIAWLCGVVAEIAVLTRVFRTRSREDKRLLCLFLSLCLLLQYCQMFGAISVNLKRLPLQLCNIGAFLILAVLVTENKHLFNFMIVVNVVGVVLALAVPDLAGKGLFYLYNMHYVFEHTNVLVIPVLCLTLGLFPRIDGRTLRDCLVGFSGYFVLVLTLGTVFNAIAARTGKSFYAANYMFMFDQKTAAGLIEPLGKLFGPQIHIGEYATLYPLAQSVVYIVFAALCVGMYFVLRAVDRRLKREMK